MLMNCIGVISLFVGFAIQEYCILQGRRWGSWVRLQGFILMLIGAAILISAFVSR